MSHKNNSITTRLYVITNAGACFFLIISILLLAYTFYRAELTYADNLDSRYYKYYTISLFGVFFWAIVLRLNYRIKFVIVSLCVFFVSAIYLIEVSLNYLYPSPKGKERLESAKRSGIYFDTRSGYQVAIDLQNKGIDAVISVYPQTFIKSNGVIGEKPIFPLSSISRKINISCNESGQFSKFLSDRYGFSNPDKEWDYPEPAFMLIGDQFAQGACVSPEASIHGKLRVNSEKPVINVSYVGNGPLIKLATLKEYGENLQPKNVLWFYYEGNDLLDELKREKTSSFLLKYLQDDFSQGLIHRQDEVDLMLTRHIAESEEKLWKTRMLRLYNIRSRIKFDSEDIPGYVVVDPLYSEIIEKARVLVESWGGKLYFIYLPQFERYIKPTKTDLYRKRNEVVALMEKLQIPVIDIHNEVFSKHPDPVSLFPMRMHGTYNEEGYDIIAKVINNYINKDEKN